MTVKAGDLVAILPAKIGTYLIIDEDAGKECSRPGEDGVPLGKLYSLYDSKHRRVINMHEKWIELLK